MRCTFCRVTPSRRAICGTVRGSADAALITCQRAWVWPTAAALVSPWSRKRPASSKTSATISGSRVLRSAFMVLLMSY